MDSNFSFFREKWGVLAKLGPHTTLMKHRLFGETLSRLVLAMENISEEYRENQVDRINTLRKEGLIEPNSE